MRNYDLARRWAQDGGRSTSSRKAMAARSLTTGAAMAMNLLRLISRSQLTRPTSVVYGVGAADEDAMARAGVGEEEALAQEKLRRTAAAASGCGSSKARERRRGDARTAAIPRGWVETVGSV